MARDKSKTMLHLSRCVFQLEAAQGHLGWKITDLVRKAGLSRPLVYRYFGSGKKAILLSALRIFTNDFYGFDESYRGLTVIERVRLARKTLAENPEAAVFYLRWRTHALSQSWIRDEFIRIEKKYQAGLGKRNPDWSEEKVIAVHAFLHGIVTAPFLTTAQAEQAYRLLEKSLA